MITPESLRIGNYLFTPDDIMVKVDGVTYTGRVIISVGGRIRNVDVLKPIPLTEDILLRFGFEKRIFPFDGSFEKDDFIIKKKSTGFVHVDTDCKLKTVHWLQNLFYFTEGKELELKE